jgi:hypothetical protein
MLNKTIAKFPLIVIFAASICLAFSACSDAGRSKVDVVNPAYQIESDEISESSGLAASQCQPNVFWTHNDSGDGPYIYAINSKGENLGTWQVKNAENKDWEDMASFKNGGGQCFLYIGEIGNTDKLERSQHVVYRVPEPVISAGDADSKKGNARNTEPAEAMNFKYSDKKNDAEALMVHPNTGEIYILTKQRSNPSGVYKLGNAFGSAVTVAQKIADLSVPAVPNGLLTGGAISPDGKRVTVCDYSAAYELALPDGAINFDEIWQRKPAAIDLGIRKQGETVTYSSNGTSIFATSEKRNSPIIEVKRQ